MAIRPLELLGSILLLSVTVIASENPFTPRAHLIRYWNNKISKIPRSQFLLSKASPLSASDSTTFSQLASHNALSTHLASFCKKANLLCFPDPSPDLSKHSSDAHFSSYLEPNFTNYGTGHVGGFDSFKNYSAGESFPVDTFIRYSRDSTKHSDQFISYATDPANTVTQTFKTYGTGATKGVGQFKHYAGDNVEVDMKFTSYSADANRRHQSFSTYSDDGNSGNQSFASYGKDGNELINSFTSYSNNSNVIHSDFSSYSHGATGGAGKFDSYSNDDSNGPELKFTSYSNNGKGTQQSFSAYTSDAGGADLNFASYSKDGNGLKNTFTTYGNNTGITAAGFSSYNQAGNGGADNFTSYGANEINPQNMFNNYAEGGNNNTESFSSYRDQADFGTDSFQSYAKESKSSTKVKFSNYGNNVTDDTFTGYGKGATGQTVDFKGYITNNTFKDYAKHGVTFSQYTNSSSIHGSGHVNNRLVEPGKFFREEKLKAGMVMPMPDINDKMPARSFLPRSILSKLPFSSSRMSEMKEVFHAYDNSTMEGILKAALRECERSPSPGETKRCVGSAEDMIDFVVSVLGNSVELRTTESTHGSKNDIMIGRVRGINGGRVTHSVSCHQSLYPYLLYYCHSVPRVRVYEADILDPNTKTRINHGVAICHLDTSSWSATHGAFLALGSGPGKIEVCHWIFENDLTWTIAD